MTDTAQACGNCKWRQPYFDVSIGKHLDGTHQPCAWRGNAPFYMFQINRWVREDEGGNCKAWTAK